MSRGEHLDVGEAAARASAGMNSRCECELETAVMRLRG